MIRHFSIPAILRMIPQPILEQFFKKMGLVAPFVHWKYLQPGEIHPILEFIAQAGTEKQMMIENALYQISELACESGIAALREASGNALLMQSADDYLSLAMRVWIEQPESFQRASLLQQVDHLERWHRRVDLPRIAPQSSNKVLSHLGKAMTDVLNEGQSRCGYCSVEHMRRADGTDCFLAYPDGVWQTTLIHDANGNLVAHSIRSALEIVFVYDRNEGIMETFADVPAQLKLQLENAFCKVVLGVDVALPQRPAYNLDVLKEGPTQLATDPADGVAAHVCRMRLAILNSLRIIILVADRSGSSEDIYAMLYECLNREHLPLSVMSITAAQFHFEFQAVNGCRPGAIKFELSHPDLSTLRNQRPDRVAVAQKYLRKWSIAVV